MLFGILFLNETIELNFIVGTMLVMLGVAVVSMQDWIKRKLQHV